jgi:O-antigen ligase
MGVRLIKFKDSDKDAKFLFWLFFLYSLLPGIAKFLGLRALFLLNLPIILFVLFRTFKLEKIKYFDVPFIIFFIFVILYIPLSFFYPLNSVEAIFYGIYTFLIPTLGYFVAKAFSMENIFKILIKICFFHAIIGVVFYPHFFIENYLSQIIDPILDGSAYLRMSSVSGSLGFSPLMLIGFNVLLVYNFNPQSEYIKSNLLYLIIFLICLILSLQRSAWLGAIISVLLVLIRQILKLKFNFFKIFLILLPLIFFFSVTILLLNSDLLDVPQIDFFSERKESFTGAADERSEMWASGFRNFINFPLGVGLGQIGLVPTFIDSKNYYSGVTDGDYIKILSETGFISILFFAFLFLSLFYTLLNIHKISNRLFALLLIIVGFSIQMIGTNISELYFVNYTYWLFLGSFFHSFRLSYAQI